jgi:hypothetical protein
LPPRLPDSCNLLPPRALELITKQYPDWHVVTPVDLDGYNRKLWTQSHHGECPGIATGHFRDKSKVARAVLLIRSKGSQFEEVLLLTEPGKEQAFTLTVVMPPSVTSRPDVTYRVPPGTYRSAQGNRTARTHFDSIALEQIEAGALFFTGSSGVSNG